MAEKGTSAKRREFGAFGQSSSGLRKGASPHVTLLGAIRQHGVLPAGSKALEVFRNEGLSGLRLRIARLRHNGDNKAVEPGKLKKLISRFETGHLPKQQKDRLLASLLAFQQQIHATAKIKNGTEPDYVPKVPEAFDTSDCPLQLIAFYLPQFHPIPENDEWWGKGFTEWTNVSKATPQFLGHYQPRLPGELGYYDLRLEEVQKQQIELAKHYGISGFCYHHYWFNGKRLLERPVNQILANPDLDFPFCLCWANENWTRRWDGQEQDVLMAQNHSPEDDLAFIRDIAPALRDPRYIRFKGRPLLLVYRVSLLPDAAATAARWRSYCEQEGIGNPYLVAARSFGIKDPEPYGFDACVEFPPHEAAGNEISANVDLTNPDFKGKIYDFRDMAENYKSIKGAGYPLIKTVCPGWDNEARKPGLGHSFHNASPANYGAWLRAACAATSENIDNIDNHPPFIFVNAWNEWAEGAYLEPDKRYGYANLHVTGNILQEFSKQDQQTKTVIEQSQQSFIKHSNAAVVLHLYYDDLYEEMKTYLENTADMDLFISLGKNIRKQTITAIRKDFPNAYLVRYANRGRDVLPFLRLLKRLKDFGYDYGCKIHTKKSPQRSDGQEVRQTIISQLLGSSGQISKIREKFNAEEKLGLLAPASSFLNLAEPDRNYNNRHWLDHCLKKLGEDQLIGNYGWKFIAGTMFWFRVDALLSINEIDLAEEDFEDELGQTDGTLAHCLERLFTMIAKRDGYHVTSLRGDKASGMAD